MDGILERSTYNARIEGTRIRVWDVWVTLDCHEDPDRVLYDEWDLTEEQVETALDYWDQNEDVMREHHLDEE